MNKAVFLDRDGVLNEAIVRNNKPYPPANLHELVIPEEVPHALNLLKKLGYLLIGATNQPDVARGITTREIVESINARLLTELCLDKIFVCYHDNQNNCKCRKPLPGLLLTSAKNYNIDLSKSFMIGDRSKDIVAGQKAGCKTILLERGYQEEGLAIPPSFTTDTLMKAATWIENN